jgi:hypothetical protein
VRWDFLFPLRCRSVTVTSCFLREISVAVEVTGRDTFVEAASTRPGEFSLNHSLGGLGRRQPGEIALAISTKYRVGTFQSRDGHGTHAIDSMISFPYVLFLPTSQLLQQRGDLACGRHVAANYLCGGVQAAL